VKLLRDLVGEDLSGRYRLVARVAGGGMGDVYRAFDMLLDRTVAVKVLQPSLARDEHLVARFRDEARAAARLAHPNVVTVYDWGAEDYDTYYMVMEFVAGSDARDLLVAHGPLEPAQAAEIVASMCDALSAAHGCGLVHRDVKPENVLISREGKVKVADFGIAAIADADRTLPGGYVPGTLRYLSPEQAAGNEATPASDVWAAGAVLSELLTGRPPLQGSGTDMLRRRAAETPTPPSDLDMSIPRALDDIVLTACALEPSTRFDASDMAIALRRAAARSLPSAPPLAVLLAEVTGEIRLPDMMPTRNGAGGSRKHRARKKKRKRSGRLIRTLATLGVTAALSVAGLGTAGMLGPRDVSVPSLVGLDRSAAADRVERAGLILEVSARRKHRRVPEGEILSQNPAGGELEQGSPVAVVVSDGPPMKLVPLVVGMDVRRAASDLESRGLTVGSTPRRFSARPAGQVIGQDSIGRRLPWGSSVNLLVSKGPQPVDVDDVTGMDAGAARRELKKSGLVVAYKRIYSDTGAEGVVIATTPPAGAVAAEGSKVEVAVSLGPELEPVTVPDVRGAAVARARSKLQSVGLEVEVHRSCSGGATVVETEPLPGTTLHEGDLVAMFVC
jgi:eukaryotic-like serine/threonine-protein kinase